MLTPYWGEFMIHPVPLELSVSPCTHGCQYCFARGDFRTRLTSTARLLAESQTRRTLAAQLLARGAPVLLSNRCDPFSASNVSAALPLMRTLTELGNGVALQTKGGAGIDEALSFLRPACWYISIAFWDEARRAQIEPGAPSLVDRFRLIEKLRAAGHVVYVGINPLVPEWLPDPEPLIKQLARLGVYGVWLEFLHLNRRQSAALPKRAVDALGSAVVARAAQRATPEEWRVLEAARQCALAHGLEVYTWQQSARSEFWAPYYQLYQGCYRTNQDFINALWDCQRDLTELTFADYWQAVSPGLVAGAWQMENYVRVGNRALFLKRSIPGRLTYADVLKIAWVERTNFSPARIEALAYSVDADGAPYLDAAGLPFLVFDRTEKFQPKKGGD